MDVVALYVDTKRGPYPALLGVENCWGEDRDASTYQGPYPVVAHPPCGQWGGLKHLAHDRPIEKECGPRAVEQVRMYGGVLEQPAFSSLWDYCGVPKPNKPPDVLGDIWGGYTLQVEQVAWGHPCRKRTWLYIVGASKLDVMAEVRTGGTITHWVSGSHQPRPSTTRGTVPPGIKLMDKDKRHLTPPAFAEWLVSIARRCG